MSSSSTALSLVNPWEALRNGRVPWIGPPLMVNVWWDLIPKRPGISMGTLMDAGVRNISADQAKEWEMGLDGGGAIIPYPRYDNREQLFVKKIIKRKRDGQVFDFGLKKFGRLRLASPPEDKDKKYDQAAGTGTQIYPPPRFPRGHIDTLVLVEGEFKALCLVENGIPAIGLSGITGWSLKQEDNSRPVLPVLLEVITATSPRRILYLADNDVATNANFYREVALFVERLTLTAGIKIPVLLPRWPLTMKKGVDDIRDEMDADEFSAWWADVVLHALPAPVGITAAQLGQTLLESCRDYVASRSESEERERLFERLARIYLYHKTNYEFVTWLKSYVEDCGFDPAQLELASSVEREKIKKKMAAKGSCKASRGTTHTASRTGFEGTPPSAGSGSDPIRGVPSGSTEFPKIENSMILVQDTTLQLPPELVEGLIHLGTKSIIAGNSKAGKTWILMDLALSVCTGNDFWGLKTQPGRVLYINLEIHRSFTKKRLEILTEKRGITDHRNLDIWNLRGHAAALGKLLDSILPVLAGKGYALVIVDPIYKVEGGRDENNAGEMAELCNELEIIAVETGAAVAYAHHFSKGQQSMKTPMDRMSGSGVFGRDPDSIITLSPHVEDKNYIVETSLRNFPEMLPFVIEWDFPIMRRRADLDPAKHRVAAGRKSIHKPEDIFTLLEARPMKTTAWEKAAFKKLGIPKTSFHRLFKSAIKKGLVRQDENDAWIIADLSEEIEEVP